MSLDFLCLLPRLGSHGVWDPTALGLFCRVWDPDKGVANCSGFSLRTDLLRYALGFEGHLKFCCIGERDSVHGQSIVQAFPRDLKLTGQRGRCLVHVPSISGQIQYSETLLRHVEAVCYRSSPWGRMKLFGGQYIAYRLLRWVRQKLRHEFLYTHNNTLLHVIHLNGSVCLTSATSSNLNNRFFL